jgi:hypothetical protein
MKSCAASTIAFVVFAAGIPLGASANGTGDGLVANWTLNDGGAVGNAIGNGATIADSGPNGYNGTILSGGDTLTSIQGVIGTGLNFSGDNSSSAADIEVPAGGTSLGGTNALTISLWVNIPNIPTASGTTENVALDLWDGGTSPAECYYLGTRYNKSLTTDNGLQYSFAENIFQYDHAVSDSSGNRGFWARTDGTGFEAGTWEQVTIEYYGGNSQSALSYDQLYVNGLFVGSSEGGGKSPVPAPSSGQYLEIGYDNGTMWKGGLNDIGIWNTNIAGAFSFATQIADNGTPPGVAEGQPAGAEVGALYNTPMYNNHTGALSQYGVSAMDKLFTLYGLASTTPVGVTTSNGTLGWQYVASGLTAGSGVAGQLSAGQFFVQLDANGGGVVTVLPGDAIGDGKVDVNDLTIVLSHFGESGQSWSTGDFIGDGKVDINDLTILLTNFGESYGSPAGAMAAVPEPSVLMLISGALAGMLAFAWRRREQMRGAEGSRAEVQGREDLPPWPLELEL